MFYEDMFHLEWLFTSIYNKLDPDELTLSAKVIVTSKGKEREEVIQTTDRPWQRDRGKERNEEG